jgi:hypothetical protein
VFGRASQDIEELEELEELPPIEPRQPVGERLVAERRDGPFDVDDPDSFDIEGGLDFGSLRLPMPARAQLQVEHGSGELLRAVHVLVPSGRVSLSALAAPRSGALWRDLASEIAGSLAKDGARVWAEWGGWGREVLAGSKGALSRFVGVDGPRWMLYGVATGPADGAEELAETLREMIRNTVVTRGPDPLPVKTVLPLRLPEHLEERVEQARAQSAWRPGVDVDDDIDAVVSVEPTELDAAGEPGGASAPFQAAPFQAGPFGAVPPAVPPAVAPAVPPAVPQAVPPAAVPPPPLAVPPPVAPAAAAGPAYDQPLPARHPAAPEYGTPGQRPRRSGPATGPARIGYPGQSTGPRRVPPAPPSRAARPGGYPPAETYPPAAAARPPRQPSAPPYRSIGIRPTAPPTALPTAPPTALPTPAWAAGHPGTAGPNPRTAPPARPGAPPAGSPLASPTGPFRGQISGQFSGQVSGRDAPGGGDRRRGLPPVPPSAPLDSNGVPGPSVESTWTLAQPVVSADQVAQQPAWALLSDAPAFWPHPTPPRRPTVSGPTDRRGRDDAGVPPTRRQAPLPARGDAPPRYRRTEPPVRSDAQSPHRPAELPLGPSGPRSRPPGPPPHPTASHPAGPPPHLTGVPPNLTGVPPNPTGPSRPAGPWGGRLDRAGRPVAAQRSPADRASLPEPPEPPERSEHSEPKQPPAYNPGDTLHLALTQDWALAQDGVDRQGRHRRPE